MSQYNGGAIPLATAQAHLNAWLAADLAVSGGQEYVIDISGTRRKLTRVNAAEIKQSISYWAHIVNQKTRPRTRFIVPTDH